MLQILLFLVLDDFPGYLRIRFSNLKISHVGVYDGLFDVLSSSVLFLKSPNDATNLSFASRFPLLHDWETVLNRKSFRNLMIPLMALETICDLSQVFMLETLTSHATNIVPFSTSRVRALTCFDIELEVPIKNLASCQQKYCNSFWLMKSQNCGFTELQLKCDDDAMKNNCILIFTKTSFIDNDDDTGVNSLTDNDDGNRIVSLVLNACMAETDENRSTLKKIFREGKTEIVFLSQVTQFLKGLKIVSVPDRPADFPAERDYNLSPAFDAFINPNLFFALFSTSNERTFKEKFNKLMTCDKLGLLVLDGAPGTGKTTTVVSSIVDYITTAESSSEELPKVLVTAPSNAAADVFYTKLRAQLPHLRICRPGEREKFKPNVRIQTQTDYDLIAQEIKGDSEEEPSKQVVMREFLLTSNIIVVTLGSSMSNEILNLRIRLQIDLLVVDECGQAKLEEILFPLHLTSISRLVLIGDPRQLGPTLKSSLMMNMPIDKTSIFVKICNFLQTKGPNAIFCLRQQHRMKPFVASIVSHISYNAAAADQLTTDPDGNWTKTNSHPALLVFSGESWKDKRTNNSFSYENQKEAEFGVALLRASLQRQGFNFENRSFPRQKELTYGIIALYRGQVNLYRRLLFEENLHEIVKVYTVDQMQGSECDIAIVSAVRASVEHYSVGFASDLRRLNVALSRAACVYVLAKYDDFKTHQGWSKLFHEAIRTDCLYADADCLLSGGIISKVLATRASDAIWIKVNI